VLANVSHTARFIVCLSLPGPDVYSRPGCGVKY